MREVHEVWGGFYASVGGVGVRGMKRIGLDWCVGVIL